MTRGGVYYTPHDIHMIGSIINSANSSNDVTYFVTAELKTYERIWCWFRNWCVPCTSKENCYCIKPKNMVCTYNSNMYLSVCLSVYLSIYLSIYLFIHPFICLNICLSTSYFIMLIVLFILFTTLFIGIG